MSKESKEKYLAPEAESVTVWEEGPVAASGGGQIEDANFENWNF